jgi:hypothetical protein
MRREHFPRAIEEDIGRIGFGYEALDVEHQCIINARVVGFDLGEYVID